MNTPRPWITSYPPGIPSEIDVNAYTSIVDVFETACERFRHRPAFANLGKTLTYDDTDRLSRDFAGFLRGELGLKKGDRVALMMPNVLQYPIAIFGVLRAGLIVVNVNPMYTPRELGHQLIDSGASTIVVLENFAHTLAQAIQETPIRHVITTGVGDLLGFPKAGITNFIVRYVKKLVPSYQLDNTIGFGTALAQGRQHDVPKSDVTHDDVSFLQYTGGTTGVAKGAMLTHRNLIANMQQASAWLGTNVREGEEIIITALPLYHIFSLTANCLVFMKFGGLNYLITNPRDMKGFVKEIRNLGFTALTGVNTLFNSLLNTPGFEQVNFSRLHLTLGGGMAVQRAVADRWKQITGVTLSEAYGLTETSPAACINPLDLHAYNGSIGLPLPSTELTIQDDNGRTLEIGEIGELCLRGPQVMKGYWNRPEETAKVLTSDGWLHTGDIARIDQRGYAYIVDRKKDMILVSGFNVYPNEIEDVVALHPGVLEVAAIGVPDEKSGEAVKVFVVKKDPGLTAEALLEHCRTNLTPYKLPRHIEFRDALPKSNVGKIIRRELRESPKAT